MPAVTLSRAETGLLRARAAGLTVEASARRAKVSRATAYRMLARLRDRALHRTAG